jgi:peptidyl-prolyl cis-trans isomerase C
MQKPLLAALACTLTLSGCHSATETETVPDPLAKTYVTVNDYPIPQYIVDAATAEQKARGLPDSPEFDKALREEMIRRGALLSEAKKRGLDKKPEHRQQVEIARQTLLMRDVVADYLKESPVTDAELQIAYNAVIIQMGNSEYKLRHIQRKTEKEAQDTLAKLKLEEGKNFARLAKETSTDPATQENGGSLGWNAPSNLPVPVGNAVKTLAKGQYTQTPVQTQAGYHVILVEDVRPFTPPTLDALKPRLLESVTQLKAAKFVEELREKAVVK